MITKNNYYVVFQSKTPHKQDWIGDIVKIVSSHIRTKKDENGNRYKSGRRVFKSLDKRSFISDELRPLYSSEYKYIKNGKIPKSTK